MSNFWVTSDLHLGHANIIGYCNRPYSSVEEMNEALVDNWNSVVRDGDHVYVLGDVAINKKYLPIVGRLRGKKRLTMGNHDIFDYKLYGQYFQKIMAIRVYDNFIMTHIPIHLESMARFKGNVHGHIHTNDSPPGPYVNVCVEKTDYRPLALEEVKERLKDRGWSV